MILVIDNYDSFTWNLVHYLMELGAKVEVVRNDAITAGQALSSGAKAFLLSPGPCTPNEAGVSLDLVAACADAGAANCEASASAATMAIFATMVMNDPHCGPSRRGPADRAAGPLFLSLAVSRLCKKTMRFPVAPRA